MTTPTPLDQQRQLVRSFVTADRQRREREMTAQQQFAAGEKAATEQRAASERTAQQQYAAAEKSAEQQHSAAIKQADDEKTRQQYHLQDAVGKIDRDWGVAVADLSALGVPPHDLPIQLNKASPHTPTSTLGVQPHDQLQADAKQIIWLYRDADRLVLAYRRQQALRRKLLITAAVVAVILAVAGYFGFQKWSYDQRIAALQQEGPAILAAVKQQARTNPVDGAVYIPIPAGEFLMGSPDNMGSGDEHPQHTVYLDVFWIMQTEVTNAQYAKCVAAGACSAPDNTHWQDAAYADHPVTNVDWNQANAYAQWAGGRLPTEAEWEKAARGTDGRTYPWGNEAPAALLANCCVFVNETETTPVGNYPAGASPYGALDMAGNVWEWTADWYDSSYYSQSPAQNPTGPSSGDYRVLRGRAYWDDADVVRVATRNPKNPDLRSGFFGFRVVSSSPGF
jgi:formylglycine-generating enzyme required for sulfatase activity